MKKYLIRFLICLLLLLCTLSGACAEGERYDVQHFRAENGSLVFSVTAEADCVLRIDVYSGAHEESTSAERQPAYVRTITAPVTATEKVRPGEVSVTLPEDMPQYYYLSWYLTDTAGVSVLTEKRGSSYFTEDITRLREMSPEALGFTNVVTWRRSSDTYAYTDTDPASYSDARDITVAETRAAGTGINYIALRENVLAVDLKGGSAGPYSDLTLSADSNTLTVQLRAADQIPSLALDRYSYVFFGDSGEYSVRKIASATPVNDQGFFTLTLAQDEVGLQEYCLAAAVTGTKRQLDPFSIDIEMAVFQLKGELTSDVEYACYGSFSPTHPVVDFSFIYNYQIEDLKLSITQTINAFECSVVPIPILEVAPNIGLDSNLKFFLDADIGGSVDFNISGRLGLSVGMDGWENAYGYNLSENPQVNVDDIDLEGEVFTGFGIGPELNLADIISFGGYAKVGPVFRAGKNPDGFVDDQKRWHACEKDKCFGGDAVFRFGFYLDFTVARMSYTIVEKHWDSDAWLMWYKSRTFGDGAFEDYCPHYAYKLSVNVKTPSGVPIRGAVITYDPLEDAYKDHTGKTTGADGSAVVYIPNFKPKQNPASAEYPEFGNEVTLSVSYTLPDQTILTAAKKITEKGYGPDRTIPVKELEMTSTDITLDIVKHTVTFHDSGSGTASGIPRPIGFYSPAGVTLPSEVPVKSGLAFAGWTKDETAAAADPAYAPGSTLSDRQDIDLYAVWQVISPDSYIVSFNPQGGRNAPLALIVPSDQDCTIPETVPVREKYTFMGWSRETGWNGYDALIQPGDACSERVNTILYAIWQLNPVSAAHIVYDINGGDAATLPAAEYTAADSYYRISTVRPSWDGKHAFTGWSLSKKSLHANYFPGVLAYIEGDTTFYAIWELDPYRIIEGDGSVFIRGTQDPLRFRADGAFADFRVLVIDGRPVDEDCYEKYEGSTIAELKPDYTESLTNGTHTIVFSFEDGDSIPGSFTVMDLPVTGDESRLLLWGILLAAALAGIALLAGKRI